MSTPSAPRTDTFGANSSAPPGTSDPIFEVLNSPNGPNSFYFNGLTGGPGSVSLVLCLYKGLPPAEIRRRFVLRPEDSISRMQRNTSLNPCGGLSHRCHTGTLVWQYEGSTSVEDHNVAQSLPGMSFGLSPPTCRCQSFHLQDPRIVVLSLSPLTVSNPYLANRLDSPLILQHLSQL